jgi:hypothetical protein
MIRNNIYKILLGVFLLILTWFMFFSYGRAASPTLPIYVNSSDMPFPVEFYQNYINNTYGGFWNLKGQNTIGWCSYEQGQVLQTFAVWQNQSIPFQNNFTTNGLGNPTDISNHYDDFDWSENTITLQFRDLANTNNKCIRLFTFYVNLNNQHVNLVSFNQANTINKGVYGNTGAVINYVSNPIYYTYANSVYPQYMLFSSNLEDFEPEPGETIEPDMDNLEDGLTKPTPPTKPTTTPPTSTTPPNIDTSSQSAFWTSLGDLLKWGFGELKGYIQWIGGLINAWLDYIGDWIEYLGDLIDYWLEIIKRAIKSLAQNIYDNFTNFFKPILDNITETITTIKDKVTEFAALFIHPFDEEEYEEQIANCQLISQYNTLVDNCEDIQAIFDNAEERDHFSLYIDFENPFADEQHRIIASEINFDWLVPLRSVYRPFLWVFALVDLFTGGMRILGNIIGGKAK